MKKRHLLSLVGWNSEEIELKRIAHRPPEDHPPRPIDARQVCQNGSQLWPQAAIAKATSSKGNMKSGRTQEFT
jgi:hypothetical protein